MQAGGRRCLMKRCLMRRRHAADQPLALLLGHGDDQARGVGGRLSGRQDDLGDAPAQEASQVELGAPAELVELKPAQLGDGLFFSEVAGEQPAQDVPHSPASTSRMRCQWVPAQ